MAQLKIPSQRLNLFHKHEWKFKQRRKEIDVDFLERTEQETGTTRIYC